VNRCLAKNPEQRFQHASDVAFALEAMSDSGSGTLSAVQQPSSRKWLWAATSVAILAVAAAVLIWWNRPPAAPVVEGITQLTDDGVPKWGDLVTDGSRIYFNAGPFGSSQIAQVSVAGGETSIVPTRLVNPEVAGIAPDGSSLLALVEVVYPGALWKIPLPAGEPKRLGAIMANDRSASFFPDGRVVFARDKDLYVAERDGSNVRKLLTAPSAAFCPEVSPDGKRIVFGIAVPGEAQTAVAEAAADGSGLREILHSTPGSSVACACWTPDGKYLLYRIHSPGKEDIWAAAVRPSLFRRSGQSTQLTNGPWIFSGVALSPDGKHIYAIGNKPRGELVRYDLKTKQFVPILGGISALHPSFSRDGVWVAYRSLLDHTLWRSRADGTDRLQLTYPPLEVSDPVISQDGKQVAFQSFWGEVYVISMDGGSPRQVTGRDSYHSTISPDGNSIVYSSWEGDKHEGLRIFDLRNGTVTVMPSSADKISPFWVSQDLLVAATQDQKSLVTFDFKSGKWTDLLAGTVVEFMPSPDGEYIYYTTEGADPMAMRIRLADHKVETLTRLKDLHRVVDTDVNTTQLSVAPDGSPVFTRDVGTREIYALTVKWP
jgi:Tol biopolymer transport system component